jgi:5-hydroxyisourate hydrolase
MTSGAAPATVSTHVLDTALGRPAAGVAVSLAARTGPSEPWQALGGAATDADGRCRDLPGLPVGATHVRLVLDTGAYLEGRDAAGTAFFPEAAVAFAVEPGQHYHVPLLLSPFGYSVYRGS